MLPSLTSDDAAHLEVGRCHRLAVDEQAPRSRRRSFGGHQAPVGSAAGAARERARPRRRRSRGRAPRSRPSWCRPEASSSPAGHVTTTDISRPASVHSTVAMYGKNSRSQSTATWAPVEVDEVERHDRVVGAGRRVANGPRRCARRRRIGDRPLGHRRLVDAAHGDRARRRGSTSSRGTGASPRRRRSRRLPHDTCGPSSGPSPTSTRDRPSSSPMRRVDPLTYATRRAVGSGRGSNTGPVDVERRAPGPTAARRRTTCRPWRTRRPSCWRRWRRP